MAFSYVQPVTEKSFEQKPLITYALSVVREDTWYEGKYADYVTQRSEGRILHITPRARNAAQLPLVQRNSVRNVMGKSERQILHITGTVQNVEKKGYARGKAYARDALSERSQKISRI